MVNQLFLNRFAENIQKDLKDSLAAAPAIWPGGQQMDHYKGLASAMATRLVPLLRETYEATEFVFGYATVKHPLVPYVFFQCAVLDIKGKNVPGVGNFGAVIRAPVPETYVAPFADWKHRLLPLSALAAPDARASKVFKAREGWTPLLEAVNADKKAVKALGRPWYSSTVGNYKVKMDSNRLAGFVQLAPYKGSTLMTIESTPAIGANVDKPKYDWKDYHGILATIGGYVKAHGKAGAEDVGQLYLNEANAAMMDLMIKQANAASKGTSG